MTPDETGRLFSAMPGLAWLDLTGGEPFLRNDITDVFRAVLQNTPCLGVLHFPTNGWYTGRVVECVNMVRETRPRVSLLVTVSVDGPLEVHDGIRGRDGSWARAIDTFEAVRDIEGVQAYIGTTVGPWNKGHLAGLRGSLADAIRGFDDRLWHWNQAQASGHFFANEKMERLQGHEAAALVRDHLRRRWPPASPVDLMEAAYLANVHAFDIGEPPGMTCHALLAGCFVSADAVMYPCHVWDRPLVDLREIDFRVEEAWAGDTVLCAREEVKRLECGGCFTPCEAYTTMACSPLRALQLTARRLAESM